MEEVANYDKLEQIGNELYVRSVEGTLDFAAFQRLFDDALAVCGPDHDAADRRIWQDVYYAPTPVDKEAYIKVTMRSAAPVIQFKER